MPTGLTWVEIRKQSAIGTEYSSCNLNTSGNREEKVGQWGTTILSTWFNSLLMVDMFIKHIFLSRFMCVCLPSF